MHKSCLHEAESSSADQMSVLSVGRESQPVPPPRVHIAWIQGKPLRYEESQGFDLPHLSACKMQADSSMLYQLIAESPLPCRHGCKRDVGENEVHQGTDSVQYQSDLLCRSFTWRPRFPDCDERPSDAGIPALVPSLSVLECAPRWCSFVLLSF